MSNLETSSSRHDTSHRRHRDRDRDYGGRYDRKTSSRSRSPNNNPSHRHARDRREYEKPARSYARSTEPRPVALPLDARPLSKRDLTRYQPLFGMYLDIQKNIDIGELDERELKGRWKSFFKKWNRGELAEGWYDPRTLEKAIGGTHNYERPESPDRPQSRRRRADSPDYTSEYPPSARNDEGRLSTRDDSRNRDNIGSYGSNREQAMVTRVRSPAAGDNNDERSEEEDEEEDEGSYGPPLPQQMHPEASISKSSNYKSGPKIPTMEDLELKREDDQASIEEAQNAERFARRLNSKAHKSELVALQEEIAPKAEPGSRERRLEKRQERAASNRTFADSKRGGSPEAAPDQELMGGGEGGGDDLETLKKTKERETRKKNEREIRKQEILRARAAEREVRLRSYRQKEDETMEYLRTIAKERFG